MLNQIIRKRSKLDTNYKSYETTIIWNLEAKISSPDWLAQLAAPNYGPFPMWFFFNVSSQSDSNKFKNQITSLFCSNPHLFNVRLNAYISYYNVYHNGAPLTPLK